MKANGIGLGKLLEQPQAQTSGYSETASEILHQPQMWKETLDCVLESSKKLKDLLGKNPRLLFSGAGSSHFAGVSVAPVLRKHFPYAEAISSTEIVMDPETAFPKENFIMVSFARSGNSPEGNAAVELAEKLRHGKVKHLAITCNQEGELAKIVNNLGPRGFALILPEGTNDKGLAMTSSFTSMVLAGLLLQFIDRDDSREVREYADLLIQVGKQVLDEFDPLAYSLSKEVFSRMYFIASRPFFGGALEAHLKVQELSGGALVAYASDTLGLRHGFMASIDDESLVILTSSSSSYRNQYERDLLRELKMKKLGKKILVIANDDLTFQEYSDIIIKIGNSRNFPDELRSIITVLVGQLIGFYASLEQGLNPDSPSPKGIINRVVDGIIIYPYPVTAGIS